MSNDLEPGTNDANRNPPPTETHNMNPDAQTANPPRPAGPLSGPIGMLVFILFFTAAGYLTYHTLTTAPIPDPEPLSKTFVCSETGKPFEYSISVGEKWPVPSPYTGRKTGYPAEACYWTKDGKRKSEPTYVILNEYLGKPGDTICPDCGRLVVGHNPMPPVSVPLVDAPATRPARRPDATRPPASQKPN